MKNNKEFSDIIIYLSECLKDIDGLNIDWRILKKYCDDFLQDNNLKIEVLKNEL